MDVGVVRIALRDLRAHIGRYVLVFGAVAIGVTFVAGTLTLSDTLGHIAGGIYADAYGGADVVVQINGTSGGGAQVDRTPGADELLDAVANVDGVADAEVFTWGQAWLVDPDGGPVSSARFGEASFGSSWLRSTGLNPFRLTDGGRPPRRSGEVAIDRRSARSAGYYVGEGATVQTPNGAYDVTVTGIVESGEADSLGTASMVLFSRGQAAVALQQSTGTSSIWVVAEDEVGQDRLIQRLDSIVTGEGWSGVEIVSGTEFRQVLLGSTLDDIRSSARPVLAFSFVAVAVAGLVIATSLNFAVAQRQRELALLRMVGASRRQVLVLVLGEALAVGVVASIVGCTGGIAAADALERLFVLPELGMDGGSLSVRPVSIALAAGTGVVVTLLSAMAPAVRAARNRPLVALHGGVDRPVRRVRRLVLGSALVVLGAVAAPLGRPNEGSTTGVPPAFGPVLAGLVVVGPLVIEAGSRALRRHVKHLRTAPRALACLNLARNPRRTTLTMGAITIGLAVVTYNLLDGAGRTALTTRYAAAAAASHANADFVVTAQRFDWVPAQLASELRRLPETGAVSDPRSVHATPDDGGEGDPLSMEALDPAAAVDIRRLRLVVGDLSNLGENGLAVPRSYAGRDGWALGDSVSLRLGVDEPTRPIRFVVAAVYDSDVPGVLQPIYASPAAFSRYVAHPRTSTIDVRIADGVTMDQGRAALSSVTDRYPLTRLVEADAYTARRGTDDQRRVTELTVRALLLLTFVVAVVGTINAQILVTIERRHEIALLRAIGATRTQVRSVLRWETVFQGLLGSTAALTVGVPVSLLMLSEQQPWLPAVIPIPRLLLVLVLTVGIVFAGSLVPAWWASRRIGPLT
jgi:putative ABC transport system permease protein